MKKSLFLLIYLLLCLRADAGIITDELTPSELASAIAGDGEPVTVSCVPDSAWQHWPWSGWARYGSRQVELRERVCDLLTFGQFGRIAVHSKKALVGADSFRLLVHEVQHAVWAIVNEGEAECGAIGALPRALMLAGATPQYALRLAERYLEARQLQLPLGCEPQAAWNSDLGRDAT